MSKPRPLASETEDLIVRLQAPRFFTQKDQVVTGETAIFDTRANLITMTGGVVLTQCKNVLRGDRLKVDMTTGVSRVESDSNKVQGMLIQGQDCGSGSGGSKQAPANSLSV